MLSGSELDDKVYISIIFIFLLYIKLPPVPVGYIFVPLSRTDRDPTVSKTVMLTFTL
jgi:hypothetical protein